MPRSMTAYGRGSLKADEGEFVCELRSVNHRYLDITIRVPETLRGVESRLRAKLSAELQRGKVEVQLGYHAEGPPKYSLSVNENLLHQLTEIVSRVADTASPRAPIDPVSLIAWPGVIVTNDKEPVLQEESALAVFDMALSDFVSTREREGEHIAEVLRDKASLISVHVSELRALCPVVIDRQRNKWIARLSVLGTDHDTSRMEQELIYAAQRLDIEEELDRLESHIIELSNALQRTEAVGRRLDFLMQEFNREANTVGSKSADVVSSKATIDIKVLIEQMREQVQNIE